MPKKSFSMFRRATHGVVPSSTEKYKAATRRFQFVTVAVAFVSLALGVAIHLTYPSALGGSGVTLAIATFGPILSILAYFIERLLEAHAEYTMGGELAELERSILAIPAVVRSAVSEDVGDIKESMKFVSAYLKCTPDVDPYRRGDRILKEFQEQMDDLVNGSFEVEQADYYAWLNSQVLDATNVHAVSHRKVTKYRTDDREKKFLKNNLIAIESGCVITRVFVLSHESIYDESTRDELLKEFVDTGMRVYFVLEEQLTLLTMQRLEGGGLSIYDDKVGFYDRSFLESTPAERIQPERTLIPKATVFLRRSPGFRNLQSIYEDVFAMATEAPSEEAQSTETGHEPPSVVKSANHSRFESVFVDQKAQLETNGEPDQQEKMKYEEKLAYLERSIEVVKSSAEASSDPEGDEEKDSGPSDGSVKDNSTDEGSEQA